MQENTDSNDDAHPFCFRSKGEEVKNAKRTPLAIQKLQFNVFQITTRQPDTYLFCPMYQRDLNGQKMSLSIAIEYFTISDVYEQNFKT